MLNPRQVLASRLLVDLTATEVVATTAYHARTGEITTLLPVLAAVAAAAVVAAAAAVSIFAATVAQHVAVTFGATVFVPVVHTHRASKYLHRSPVALSPRPFCCPMLCSSSLQD